MFDVHNLNNGIILKFSRNFPMFRANVRIESRQLLPVRRALDGSLEHWQFAFVDDRRFEFIVRTFD